MAAVAENVLIWGGGGHGKVVADLVRATGGLISGFVDGDPGKLHRVVEPGGERVTMLEAGFLEAVRSYSGYPLGIDTVAFAIGNNEARLFCLRALDGLPVATLVHPSAVVSPSARLGKGVVIFAGAVVNADARIGDAVIINTGAIVEHDCVIGVAAHISPGATLAGNVRVGERSWIGSGATVIPGLKLGSHVTVGAGTIVIHDVGDGVTLVGNPGRVIRVGDR